MRLIDFFAGIGMFSRAGHELGMQTVAWVEIEPFLQTYLRRHYPEAKGFSDIGRTAPQKLPAAEVWTAGFPCQDISVANVKGRTNINGTRSGLYQKTVDLAGHCRPAYLVFENTPAIRVAGLDQLLLSLAQIGYDAEWTTISAGELGAPIYRERFFLVASPSGQRLSEGLEVFAGEFAESWRKEMQARAKGWYPLQPPPSGSDGYEVWRDAIVAAGGLAHDAAPELSAGRFKALGNSVHWLQALYVLGCVQNHYHRTKQGV
ncbi:MAG: DNA cytosine methyltransferase [Bacteroidia bacterium]|nr:DNA cytosine methyltransferase [Bacteroidia bacterium]